MGIRKTGNWSKAIRGLDALAARTGKAMQRALLQEAHTLRKMMVEGLTDQAPGGSPIAPLSALTLANRRLQKMPGSKALIARGDLRNSLAVVGRRGAAFVGVLRNAVGSDGKSLVDLGQVHEFGSDPIIVPVTAKMRRYVHLLMGKAGMGRPPLSGHKRAVLVVQVPPRPFMQPAYAVFIRDAGRRFRNRLSKELNS